jgi:hypothetical protein
MLCEVDSQPRAPYIIHEDGSISQGESVGPDQFVWEQPASDLTFIRIDHQSRIQVERFEFVIGLPFSLKSDGVAYALDPAERSGLGPFLALYPDTLEEVTVDGQRTLALRFGGGASITVPANPKWEAWQIVGPGTALVVCSPGGRLAIWT